MLNMDIELQDSRWRIRSVANIYRTRAKAVCTSPLRYFHCKPDRMVPWPQAAQGHTPTLQIVPPLKKRHVCGKLIVGLVVAVILHQG
jgi:hypothetical protein